MNELTTDKYPSRDPLWRRGPCNPTGLPRPGRDEHSYQYHPGRGGCKGEKQMPAARCLSPCELPVRAAVDHSPQHWGKHK